MINKSKICYILTSLLAVLAAVGIIYSFKFISIGIQGHQIDKFVKHAGYYQLNQIESQSEDGSFTAILSWVKGKKEKELNSSPVVKDLRVTFKVDANDECQFKITDLSNSRFHLPENEPYPFTKQRFSKKQQEFNLFETEISQVGQKFYFELRRKSTKEIIFSTKNFPIYFTDKYIEVTTQMKDSMIFGLGDRRTDFLLKSGKYSLWTRDAADIDNGTPGKEIYGFHPMYLRRDIVNNQFQVTLFRNYYGMQVDYEQNSHLTYKVIGGNIDFKFFISDSNPENSIKLYHNYINGWILHPFWSSGFHQCRWGYKNSDMLMDVWNNYNKYEIPFDSLWTDIDYMYKYQDFTIDFERFNITQMQQIYNLSDPNGVHWSSIVDVGIALDSDAAEKGLEMNVFIQSAKTNQSLIGKVWPGKTYFPDFNHPNSTEFWYDGLKNLSSYGISQDGIWIDMNEFSNFVPGELVPSESLVEKIKSFFAIDQPALPFNPLGIYFSNQNSIFKIQLNNQINMFQLIYEGLQRIDHKTLSLDSKHYSGYDQGILYNSSNGYIPTQYDFHNLNGFGEGIATYKAAQKLGKKLTFILSRSTAVGSGRYVQHWNGDGYSTWEYMKLSIPSIMNFNMYGIPFNGDDICGLMGDATAEVCARWQQLGSLYPFSRNHNNNDAPSQEPYVFKDHPYVLSSTIKTLNVRYQLLKFYYHLFVKANGLGTIFRPLFWSFSNDDNAYTYETQFMVGDYLMAAPVVQPGNAIKQSTHSCVYIPKGESFYNFYDYTEYKEGEHCYEVPFDSVLPLYIKSGKIVHIQDKQKVLRSRFLDNTFTLMIVLDENNYSSGSMLTIDDYNRDENIISNCIQNYNCVIDLFAQGKLNENNLFQVELRIQQEKQNTTYQIILIDKLIVIGAKANGKSYQKTINLNTNPWIIDRNDLQFNFSFQI
ncbi:family 31 glycoside hydrolase (macronuclear) [Tetrahymena thermophila SB210]|uniref:Maltase n=1 Tax=Tetrahymena thermophila (strain SB210) TaxID=312017 RepID=Q22RK7_TETTS|nr:family 31 glycoside hydrolase [Tetrahymena thermophila SB210]EAR88115.2 family 31 glycoside hydrolase [Tetrahymena thermophila SB210]|eukprot:XP_001008360.2 family 31 glycoside hydrolase [Tetrahymena thermophila SB210]